MSLSEFVQKCRAWMLLTFLVVFPARAAEPAPENLEYKVKAVLLLKLASYIEWPTNTFSDHRAPFQIAILGADPFGQILDQVVAGEFQKHHPVKILRATNIADCAAVQMIFVPASEKEKYIAGLASLQEKPILTVSDLDKFAKRGGMVGMVRDEKSIRFEVNVEACNRAGLNISARLSTLARVVKSDK